MALTFEITELDQDQGLHEGDVIRIVECEVRDDEHPKVRAFFRFVVNDLGPGKPRGQYPFEVRLAPLPHRWDSNLTPGLLEIDAVRDAPLVKWERAAGAHIAVKYNGLTSHFFDMPASVVPKEHRDRLAADLAVSMYPEIAKAGTPVERRRRESLVKLAQVAIDYRAFLADGRDDPAAEISRQHDVTPATARSWIHRARKAGFLAPAGGRTAGEQRYAVYRTATGSDTASSRTTKNAHRRSQPPKAKGDGE